MNEYDIVVIGGGIIGISTAWQLQKEHTDAKILLIEKENTIAQHQTGHNSGVIHAGVYYEPGSLKADFCKRGATLTTEFCDEYNISYERCGKMLVATNQMEYDRMNDLENRCEKNGIITERLSKQDLSTREPSITGSGAILYLQPALQITRKSPSRWLTFFRIWGAVLSWVKRLRELRKTAGMSRSS